MSTSAPDILEFETNPLLNSKVQRAQIKSASVLIADKNESNSHEVVYDYPVEHDEHFPSQQLCECSARQNKQSIFVTDGEKNQRWAVLAYKTVLDYVHIEPN